MQERRKIERKGARYLAGYDWHTDDSTDSDSDLDSDSEVKTSEVHTEISEETADNITGYDASEDGSNGSSFMASDGDETDLLVLDVQSGTAVGASIKQGTYPSISWVLVKNVTLGSNNQDLGEDGSDIIHE